MGLWVIRGGQHGEWEDIDFEQGIVVIHSKAPDLLEASDANELRKRIRAAYPEKREQTIGLWTRWAMEFLHEMREGDLILLPLKKHRGYVAIGEIRGPAQERPDLRIYKPGYFVYGRPVRWLMDRVPRDLFSAWINRPHTTIHPVREEGAEESVRERIRTSLR